jgi:hypothetical protein
MSLADRVHIARRFQRSIRIDTDLGDPRALEGFICPQSSADVLLAMTRHVRETGQGAFTWTGPYGGGKSSLVVALSALLNGNPALQKEATRVFGRKLAGEMARALPPGTKGWRILPVVGRRDQPVTVIGEAAEARLDVRRPRSGWNEKSLVSALTDAAGRNPKAHGGLIVFVDEMGKFLEAAAHDSADLHLFQELAEAASRSNGRLLVVGILHQAFDEYAQRLSHEKRDEWAKIQGRFVDLAVNTAGEEQIDLLSRAIQSDHRPQKPGPLATEVALIARQDRRDEARRLAELLERCWPLHPAVACLLGPISRRRFGQNQRSLFGFLNSSEPHGFQDFLRAAGRDLYDVEELWDYLRANLEPSILASPDGHRWALSVEAVERCEATSADTSPIRVLKTIALIDLFKERSGLLASARLLRACLPQMTHAAIAKALTFLQTNKLIIFRKFQDAYAVFAGSDFDIEAAVRQALDDTGELDFALLNALAGFQPLLAKRHYHETGAMRWFEVRLTPLRVLGDLSSEDRPAPGTVGQFLLAIPTDGERADYAEELCRAAARRSEKQDIVVGLSAHAFTLGALGRELIALETVRNDRPELAGDPVARREVIARLAAVQSLFESELRKALDTAVWYRKYQHGGPKAFGHADLNGLASDLADRRFEKSPRLHNELLNRQKPSGSAIAAQNELLKRMVLNEGQERLGIDGFPAEGGLFASILEATGLYARDGGSWRFVVPAASDEDGCRLSPLWNAASDHLQKNGARTVTVAELYDLWRQQPYGMKDGLMPVLAVAFVLSQRNKLAVYREGIFRARFNDVDVQYLAKDAATIQLRWMDLSDVSRRLLSDMADIVRGLDEQNSLVHLEAIDVARGLVGIYESLPSWTKRTMRLSANAIRIRELFKAARDPNQFLFDDIPEKLGTTGPLDEEDVARIVTAVREALEELAQAYPSMLRRLRDIMLAELQVPNLSAASLAELRSRAENIRQLAGDFHLDAYINRLAQFDASDIAFEGIASLAADKPPRDWVDPDLDRSAINLADMAQKVLRAETFARVKGRPEKRHAMAVVIGMNGRPAPLLEEFHVADTDRAKIDNLIERVAATLEDSDSAQRNVILAALAELSARYMHRQDHIAPARLRKGESV